MSGRMVPDFSAALTVNGSANGVVVIAPFFATKGPFAGASVNRAAAWRSTAARLNHKGCIAPASQ